MHPRLILGLAAGTLLALSLSTEVGARDPEPSMFRYRREAKPSRAKSDLLETKFRAERREYQKQRKRAKSLAQAPEPFTKHSGPSQEMIDQQIEFLTKLLTTTDAGDPDYPDYLFRLAAHYLDKQAFYELQVGALYENIYLAEDDPNAKPNAAEALRAEQAEFQRQARAASENAVKVYARLVTDPTFAKYERLDEVLHGYAIELGRLGEQQRMQDAYRRLFHEFPSSPQVPRAYLSLADHHFEKSEIAAAVPLYERVLQFKDSPAYAHALYKLAWCHLNPIGEFAARYDESLDDFVATIDATNQGRAGSEAAGKQLRRNARRDLVRAYIHTGKPAEAWALFSNIGNGPGQDEQDARMMMELLALEYFGDGQTAASTDIYEQLQALFVADAMTCAWQGRIVINTLATDDKDLQWRATEALANAWTALSSSEQRKSIEQACRDDTHARLQQIATVWHAEADNTHDAHTRELAERAYELFLATFPSGPDSYAMQYDYAELLWSSAVALADAAGDERAKQVRAAEAFRWAHEQFVKVLELDPEGEFSVDAAHAQLRAMKNAIAYEETGGCVKACKRDASGLCVTLPQHRRTTPSGKPSEDYPESDYSEDERQMLKAYDVYAKYVVAEDDPELPKILYQRAKLMMAHNRFDEAEPLLVELVTRFDEVAGAQQYAVWSAEMLVDLLTIRWQDTTLDSAEMLARSQQLLDRLDRLQSQRLWAHPDSVRLHETVQQLRTAIGWRVGLAQHASGRAYVDGAVDGDPKGFHECAATFIELFNDDADHERADTWLWNAADCLDASYQVGQAIQIRKTLLERFPDSEHAKPTQLRLAESYQAVAHYEESAASYEAYAQAYAKDREADAALHNAYLVRLGLGQQQQAHDDLAQYQSLYERRDVDKAAMIFWSQQQLLDSDTARREHAVDYLARYGTKGGIDRAVVAEAVIAQIDWRRGCDEPLLYDACMTIVPTRRISGPAAIREREYLQARQRERRASAAAGAGQPRFSPRKRCGARTHAVITLHRRNKKLSAAAQARFAKILKLVGTGERVEVPAVDAKRIHAFREAWAMAIIYSADAQYEAYLRLAMPEKLDFLVEEWRRDSGVAAWEREYVEQAKRRDTSVQRISAYLEQQTKLGRALQERYAAVAKTNSAHWTLAAAARTGSLLHDAADQLYSAEIPTAFRSDEQVWAYCDTLADYAAPIHAQALAAYADCVERSTELQFANEFSRLCEDELQQLEIPATHELFGVSIYTTSQVDSVGVLEDPDGARPNPVERRE